MRLEDLSLDEMREIARDAKARADAAVAAFEREPTFDNRCVADYYIVGAKGWAGEVAEREAA